MDVGSSCSRTVHCLAGVLQHRERCLDPVRIGIDLHTVKGLMQGSRTYVWNLTKSLLALDRENEYFLYLPHGADPEAYAAFRCERTHFRVLSRCGRAIRLTTEWPLRLLRDRVDLFLCQYIGPVICPCPYVVAIHDIIHETHPEFFPTKLRLGMSLTYPRSARSAAAVITGSQFSADTIARLYRVPSEHIHVTPYAVSDDFVPLASPAEAARVRRHHTSGAPYILFVGRIEPRKNIPGLLNAYKYAREQYGIRHKLVVAGMCDPLFTDFHGMIHALSLDSDVITPGGVPQEELPGLYGAADLFVYPSFAEGFGLPVLEAMACCTAVVTSNSASLPEVLGDAGILVAPGDDKELGDTIGSLLSNGRELCEMERKGRVRAELFSWEKTARQTLTLLESVSGIL